MTRLARMRREALSLTLAYLSWGLATGSEFTAEAVGEDSEHAAGTELATAFHAADDATEG